MKQPNLHMKWQNTAIQFVWSGPYEVYQLESQLLCCQCGDVLLNLSAEAITIEAMLSGQLIIHVDELKSFVMEQGNE